MAKEASNITEIWKQVQAQVQFKTFGCNNMYMDVDLNC